MIFLIEAKVYCVITPCAALNVIALCTALKNQDTLELGIADQGLVTRRYYWKPEVAQ